MIKKFRYILGGTKLYHQCSARGIKNKLITKARLPNIPTKGRLDWMYFMMFIFMNTIMLY
jgi:hypothetical protein